MLFGVCRLGVVAVVAVGAACEVRASDAGASAAWMSAAGMSAVGMAAVGASAVASASALGFSASVLLLAELVSLFAAAPASVGSATDVVCAADRGLRSLASLLCRSRSARLFFCVYAEGK